MAIIPYVSNLASLREFYWSGSDVSTRQDAPSCLVEASSHKYSLGLGLSSRCNFHCPMCYYHDASGKMSSHDMPLSLLGNILKELPVLENIVIGFEGEPFCYPFLFQAMDMMLEKTDGFSLVSNGSLLTREAIRRVSQYPVKQFALSIDAADSQGYSVFRKGGELATFCSNATNLADALGDRVFLHSVIFAENLYSIPEMPRLAHEIGIHALSLQQVRPHAGACARGVHPARTLQLVECLSRLADSAEKYDIRLCFNAYFGNETIQNHLALLARNNPLVQVPATEKACPYISNCTTILSDGRLFPCCGDFQAEMPDDYSFNAIFNHPYLRYLRACHEQRRLPEACSICRYGTIDRAEP